MPKGHRGRDRMVVVFTTTCAKGCVFEPRSWRAGLDTILFDKICH